MEVEEEGGAEEGLEEQEAEEQPQQDEGEGGPPGREQPSVVDLWMLACPSHTCYFLLLPW